jgi:hypothetical protein
MTTRVATRPSSAAHGKGQALVNRHLASPSGPGNVSLDKIKASATCQPDRAGRRPARARIINNATLPKEFESDQEA